MTKKAIWFDPDNERMGFILMSQLNEWLKTARPDLLLEINEQTHAVSNWLSSPDRLASLGAGPSLLERTYAKSISLRDLLEGGWKSGTKIAKFAYYVSPAVITEGTIHVAKVTVRPFMGMRNWRLRRRAVAEATVPPRQVTAPLFVESEIVEETPKIIRL